MPRDDDYEDDDQRPRRRRAADDDEDDRPRRRSARGADDDEDDRPRRRRSRDDYDDEDDRPRRKSAKALPGLIMAVGIVDIVFGGLYVLAGLFNSCNSILSLNQLQQQQMAFGRMGFQFGPDRSFTAFAIVMLIAHLLVLFAAAGVLTGGIMMLTGRRVGRVFALIGTTATVVIVIGEFVALLVLMRGLFMHVIVVPVLTLVFAGGVCVFNYVALMNARAVRDLR